MVEGNGDAVDKEKETDNKDQTKTKNKKSASITTSTSASTSKHNDKAKVETKKVMEKVKDKDKDKEKEKEKQPYLVKKKQLYDMLTTEEEDGLSGGGVLRTKNEIDDSEMIFSDLCPTVSELPTAPLMTSLAGESKFIGIYVEL